MFNGLNIGLSALRAQKTSLETTGHNIANANNEDYTRQRAIQQTKVPNISTNGRLLIGSGVEIKEIQRVQDEFVNQQVREESQSSGFWDKMQQGLERIEYIFNEPSETGLKSAFNSFWNSLQDLNSNPNDTATRETVKNQGMVLADTFRNVSDQLSDYKRSLNSDFDKTVSEINSMVETIGSYNKQITTALASNLTPNDLLDKREALFNKLNELVDVKGKTDQVGNLNITLDGKALINKSQINTLETVQNPTYADTLQVDLNGTKIDIEANNGELKGIQEVRDTEITEYKGVLDQIAYNFADQFNAIHRNGFDAEGNAGEDFFALPDEINASNVNNASKYIKVSDAIKAEGGINKIAAGNYSSNPDVVTVDMTATNISSTDASTYYEVEITEGTTKDFKYAITAKYSDGTETTYNGEVNTDENIDLSTQENFQLKANTIGEATINFTPSSGNANNAPDLAGVINQDGVLNGATLTDNYEALVSTIGVNAQNANHMQSSQESLVDQLKNIKESVSGVSLDEEMANLIKYQQGYNAAAKLITKTDEMLNTLMGMIR